MKRKLLIMLVAILLFTINVYAHGTEDHSSQSIIDIIRNISLRQVAILGGGVAFSAIFTGVLRFLTKSYMSPLFILMTTLTVFAGFIHLVAGIGGDYLLIANGIGFIGFAIIRSLTVVQQSKFNKLITLALLMYTAITFAGYFLTHEYYDIIGISSKLTEVILFVILLRELIVSNSVADVVINSSTSPAV